MAKIQRCIEKGVFLLSFFKNPPKAKKALVKIIFFSILNWHLGNYPPFSIEKSRVILKKTWWQVSSSVSGALPNISSFVLCKLLFMKESGSYWWDKSEFHGEYFQIGASSVFIASINVKSSKNQEKSIKLFRENWAQIYTKYRAFQNKNPNRKFEALRRNLATKLGYCL